MHTRCLIHNSVGQAVFVLSAFGNACPIAGNEPKSPSRVAETALGGGWDLLEQFFFLFWRHD